MTRVHFAPSPTGQLHVGNARTALFNWLLARHTGGRFILRIEDSDAERSTRESEAGIVRALRWMGLGWDEGPDIGGACGPYRQSDRLEIYREHAERLLKSRHAYYCFCPPQVLEADRQAAIAAGRPPMYAGTCRAIPESVARARVEAGEPAVVRFRVPEAREVSFQDVVRGRVAFHTDIIGDPVLLRSGGFPAYNFAVVVDDGLMEISHVVRGEDHISNTPRQLLIYEAFGWQPPIFAHLSLVMGPDHTPLSKRHGATSVEEFRARGYLPEALVNYLALIGWSPGGEELVPIGEMIGRFTLEAVGHSPGVFDVEKLAWASRHYLKLAQPARVVHDTWPYLVAAGYVGEPTPGALELVESLLPMAAGAVDRFEQIPPRLATVFEFDVARSLDDQAVVESLKEPGAIAVIRALADELSRAPRLDRDTFRAVAGSVRARTGQKGRGLFHPARVALTGRSEGPELDLVVPAIDRAAELPAGTGVVRVVGCRERSMQFAAAIDHLDLKA